MVEKTVIFSLLKQETVVVPKSLLRYYSELKITGQELPLLILLLGDKKPIDVKKLSQELKLTERDIMGLISSLKDKNLIKFEMVKINNKAHEYLSLDPFYLKLAELVGNDLNGKQEQTIFENFEKEFGRTLSPIEYEIINSWLEHNMNEDLINLALKEAIFNGVNNLRYIDKILADWEKKGIKTATQAKAKMKARKDSNDPKLFDYNWLDD